MTLNSNAPGSRVLAGRSRLDGGERALDVLVGLVVIVAQLFIALISVFALYRTGRTRAIVEPAALGQANFGFGVAVFGAAAVIVITILVYLARAATGRRSWGVATTGAVLMTAIVFVGYLIMAS